MADGWQLGGRMPRLAFVVPRYGVEVLGGAETLVRDLAERLVQDGHVALTILTTCARQTETWHNQYPAGEVILNGVWVKRFPVDAERDEDRLQALRLKLAFDMPLAAAEQAEWMAYDGHSSALYRHLFTHQHNYDLLFFIPYLFGLSLYGSAIVPQKSIAWLCLHDEPYAYWGGVAEMVHACRGLQFNSVPEQQLAERLYGPHPRGRYVGAVLSSDASPGDGVRFRQRHGLGETRLLLYAGRISVEKNVPLLLEYFQRYCHEVETTRWKLVLMGKGAVDLTQAQPNVSYVGFLPDNQKADAFAAATLFCQPSVNESLSLVIFESWLAGVPVLVHHDCTVTRGPVLQSGGGFTFGSYEEFKRALETAGADGAELQARAARGRDYAQAEVGTEAVLGRFYAALDDWLPDGAPSTGVGDGG